MKATFRILTSILIIGSCCTFCTTKKPAQTNRIVVTGTIRNFKDTSTVFSYDVFELLGTIQKPKVKINSGGTFKMVIESEHPLKGFFSFGRVPFTYNFDIRLVNGKDSSLSVESADFRMVYLWLEPGDSLTMNLDVERINETLFFAGPGEVNNVFVNLEENEFASYKHKYLENYYNITYREPADFKRVVDQLRQEKLKFIDDYAASHTLSPHLIKVYQSEYNTAAVTSKIYYPGGHSGFNNGREAVLPADYFAFLDSIEISDQIGDKGITYFYYLSACMHKKQDLATVGNPEKGDFYQYVKSQLKGPIAYEFMAYALARDFKKSLYEEFGAGCSYPAIAKLVKEKYQQMEGMLEGNPAPDFTLNDVNGKVVTMNELRGKYVYFDFWATWCVPCIKEIPSLKKTEEEYRDKNIQFVSISYDKAADHDKWKKYVIDNKLTGIQLIADDQMHSVYNKTFNIDLIPRFILIDPEGKIVSANAPRPSSPKLKELLDKVGER
ncbi:MAG: TlpA disulfide reductase family protein [Bacteroidales bacterium]|jgi:peroxiredoxin